MTRKMISAIIALILCFSLVFSVSAAPNDVTFVVDEVGYMADAEIDLLNDQAAAIYDESGFGVFYVYTTADEIESYDVEQLVGGIEDYYVMIENDTSWYSFFGGSGETYIDLAAEEYLRGVYDAAPTYVEGVSDYLDAAADCLPSNAEAPAGESQAATEYFIFDEAYLLNDADEAALEKKLQELSHTYNAQIVICTIASMDGGDIDKFDDYLYDNMGFGYGENYDGVMLLICMDPREYRILSNGFAGVAIDGGDISDIGDIIVSDLSDGDYASAFDSFADQCAYYLDGHVNGFPFRFGKNLVIALVIGIAAGLIVSFVLKGQLKTVRKQDKANVYVKPGSMNVTTRSDIFLYRSVTRSQKSSSSGSSGGGSRSSGGGSF